MSDNNSTKTTVGSGGIGFTGLLTIVFIILKLCHVINWNWFWVLSPLIFSIGAGILVIVVLIILGIIVSRV